MVQVNLWISWITFFFVNCIRVYWFLLTCEVEYNIMLGTSTLPALLAFLFIVVNAHQTSLRRYGTFSRPRVFQTDSPYSSYRNAIQHASPGLQIRPSAHLQLRPSSYETRLFSGVGTEDKLKGPKPIKIIIAGAPAAGIGIIPTKLLFGWWMDRLKLDKDSKLKG